MNVNKKNICISAKAGRYNCNCRRCRMINGKPVNEDSEKLAFYESRIFHFNSKKIIKDLLKEHIKEEYLQKEISDRIGNIIKKDFLNIN